MRRLLVTLGLLVASSLQGQEAAPPPAAVPQAVKALEYLKAQPNAGPTSWTNGPYEYDGAGNIKAIGPETYVYDKIGRLKTSTLRGPDLSSMQTQSFEYDAYGNLISTSKLGQTINLSITGTTNRLSALGYDASGNVITAGTQHYDYDGIGMPNTVRLGADAQPRIIYAYTADDERLFAFDVSTGTTHWTLRGFDNKVLRDFKQNGATWSVERDYVYRGEMLLAALKPGGAVEHYSLDHLGTPRLVTDGAGNKIGYHVYWPFGEEWSPGTAQENSPLKFTGHERDDDPTGGNMSLDYMHARKYGAGWGRFLSVDPGKDWDPKRPQSWNGYAYVNNNPANATDPTGKEIYYQVHPVALGYSHSSIRIEPVDQQRYANDPDFKQYKNGKKSYMTLGAGKESGLLVSNVNRTRDVDLTIKTTVVKLDLKGRNENQVIAALRSADAKYKDNLPYQAFPAPASKTMFLGRTISVNPATFNSNSYASGLLLAVGIQPPVVKEDLPGKNQPVPAKEFH